MHYFSLITAAHTALSIFALILGVPAIVEVLGGGPPRRAGRWFIALAFATSATGFLFPFRGFTPAIAFGVAALIILAIIYLALRKHLQGAWGPTYAVSIVASEYLLVFVAIVQAFLKVPDLHQLAPRGTEPPFAYAQLTALIAFLAIGIMAAIRFRHQTYPTNAINGLDSPTVNGASNGGSSR